MEPLGQGPMPCLVLRIQYYIIWIEWMHYRSDWDQQYPPDQFWWRSVVKFGQLV